MFSSQQSTDFKLQISHTATAVQWSTNMDWQLCMLDDDTITGEAAYRLIHWCWTLQHWEVQEGCYDQKSSHGNKIIVLTTTSLVLIDQFNVTDKTPKLALYINTTAISIKAIVVCIIND